MGCSQTDAGARGELDAVRAAALLGASTRAEVLLACGFRECSGLGLEQVEDLHHETVLALLKRRHRDEEHLLRALRCGIKQRALRHHRDVRRRLRVLRRQAGGLGQAQSVVQEELDPARQAALAECRAVSTAFLATLDELERELFMLDALDGVKYRSAAVALRMDAHVARSVSRRVERKRARFEKQWRECGGVLAA